MRPLSLAPYALGGVATLALAGPAVSADLTVSVEIPRLEVAEYHAPYVAIWVENPANSQAVATLAVWYDFDAREDGGRKWLADIRTWWRKQGREMTFPVNGLSGATRAPGRQTLRVAAAQPIQRRPQPGGARDEAADEQEHAGTDKGAEQDRHAQQTDRHDATAQDRPVASAPRTRIRGRRRGTVILRRATSEPR